LTLIKCLMKLNADAEFILHVIFTDSGLLLSVGVLLQIETYIWPFVLD